MSIEPETPATSRPTDPLAIIRRAHRYVRLTTPVWSLALALLGFVGMRAQVLGWWGKGDVAGGVAAGASTMLLIAWLVRARRLTIRRTVRKLDARWELRARVESAWEMAGSESALARAQRDDLARRISEQRVPLRGWWRGGLALVGIAVAVLLAQLAEPIRARRSMQDRARVTETKTVVADGRPPAGSGALAEANDPGALPAGAKPPSASSKPTADLESKLPPPKIDTGASLTWMRPTGEIKATTIETVPLVANVMTRSGLHHATLEVSVNGSPRASVPVSAEVANQICVAAEVRIQVDLHLDELGVKGLDYVTYHLRAERNAPEPVPAVVSGIQFIEIKPLKDKQQGPPPEKNDKPLIPLFFSMLTTHMDVMKGTFAALNASSGPATPNARGMQRLLSREQYAVFTGNRLGKMIEKILEDEAKEAPPEAPLTNENSKPIIPYSLERGLPSAIKALERAAATLESKDLARAYQDQQVALVALIACKEDFGEADPALAPEDRSPTDPFEDRAKKEVTGAGRLQALATREGAIREALGELVLKQGRVSSPNEDLANLTEAQGKLARDIQQLSKTLMPGDGDQLDTENAGMAAGEAAGHLGKGDLSRALARASQASRDLQEAMRKQELSGRAEGQAQLEDARRQIEQAREASSVSEKSALLNAAAGQLRDAAAAQLAHGSQTAATALAEVAAAIEALAGPEGGSAEKWSAGEQKAAAAQVSLGTAADAADRVARQLRRAREKLAGMGPGGMSSGLANGGKADSANTAQAGADLKDLKLAAQVAAVLLSYSASDLREVRGLEAEANLVTLGKGNLARLIQAIERVEQSLARRQPAGRRNEAIRKFDPDEVDPEYRSAIEAYFGKLSEGAKP